MNPYDFFPVGRQLSSLLALLLTHLKSEFILLETFYIEKFPQYQWENVLTLITHTRLNIGLQVYHNTI